MNNFSISLDKIFIGKFLLASLFIFSALRSLFFGFDGFVGMVASKGIPFPKYAAFFALLLKLLGGLSIISGVNEFLTLQLKQLFQFALIIFTIIATVLFHNAFKDSSQFAHMMKNISIIGGLLLL